MGCISLNLKIILPSRVLQDFDALFQYFLFYSLNPKLTQSLSHQIEEKFTKNAFCFQILKTFLNSWTKQTYNVLNAKINYIPEILLGEISSHNALPFLQNH